MIERYHDLVDMFDNSVRLFAKRTAIRFGSKNITYKELGINSGKLATALEELGIKKYDKVALWLPNCPEYIYAFFAILKLGATVVPINNMFKREEAKHIIQDAGTKVMICSVDKVNDSINILSRVNSLKNIISVGASNDNAVIDFYKLINDSKEYAKAISIEIDSVAEIIYTSGTTGRSKGACLTHNNLLVNIRDSSVILQATEKDVAICLLPLFHSFASMVCMLLPIYNGAAIVLMRSVKPFKRVMRAIGRYRVSVFVGVPSLYHILSEVKFSWFKLLLMRIFNPVRLYVSGAASLPVDVLNKFQNRFKRPLLEGYGLTEASPVVSINPLKAIKPGSVGIPMPSLEIKVIDSKGEELPRQEVGELLVKGQSIMKGYYNLEEESKAALRDGWLYTGDLAKIDNDGYIYIMGRLKEMINVRGFNVYPREIEELLYQHPNVQEAAVVGVNHPHRGEVPVAFIVAKSQIPTRDINNFLKANLASYKLPLRILIKDNLPKNQTGKILKKDLYQEVKDIFAGRSNLKEVD